MVGAAVLRRLLAVDCDLVPVGRNEVDLTRQTAVESWFERNRPECVIVAAAKVGGIRANDTLRAEFIYENMMIAANVIDAAYRSGVEKLLYLGSSCVYPREAPQPMREGALLTGRLEPTNEPYAVAKIAGLKLCESYRRQYGCDFISLMPTNLYGPGDNFHPEHAHAPAALLSRFHAAKLAGAESVTVWGSGRPRREFMHVDDLADAAVFLLENYSGAEPVNVGCGVDLTIAEFAELIRRAVGFEGRLEFDASRPDGAPRKLLDVSKIAELGWRARIPLEQGLASYSKWYLDNQDQVRR